MGPVEITRGFTCYDQYPHDLGEGYGGRGIMGYINGMGSGTFLLRPPVSRLPLYLITPLYPATALSHYPLTPFLSRHPTISFRMASREGRNCLQDLMRHIHCRRAILTRYHRPRTLAGCLKERFELELQRFFMSTLQLLDLDGRPLSCLGVAPANHTLPGLEIDRQIIVSLEETQPTHPIRRHAAGGQVGHAAAPELNAGVGDINRGGQHRHPRSAHLFNGTGIQR